jgi:bifunctional ADP-heptose synthase (sugar kinase/adenylyltransferase)
MAGNVLNNIKSLGNNISEINSYFNEPNLIKKIRFIDKKSNYQLLRYDIEKELKPLAFEDIEKKEYDAIVISDYNKGYITDLLINKIVSFYKNSKIFVDTKRQDLSNFKNCIIKINKLESEKCFNLSNNSKLIITSGANGCTFEDKIYPTKKVDVHDVCGAGDVFLAALVVGWIETKDISKAINSANNSASLSVTKHGCYTVSREEYENLCI